MLPGYFTEYAEVLETGESSIALANAAKENKVHLIGGSFPELKDGKLFNTCTVWNPVKYIFFLSHRFLQYK